MAHVGRPETAMDDVLYLALGVALFAAASWLLGNDRPAPGGRP